jgi:hypothetical protein
VKTYQQILIELKRRRLLEDGINVDARLQKIIEKRRPKADKISIWEKERQKKS